MVHSLASAKFHRLLPQLDSVQCPRQANTIFKEALEVTQNGVQLATLVRNAPRELIDWCSHDGSILQRLERLSSSFDKKSEPEVLSQMGNILAGTQSGQWVLKRQQEF